MATSGITQPIPNPPACTPRVQVQLRTDERYGIVRFRSPDAARAALEALHGSDILGEALSVTPHDPAATPRNTKRPRVAA